MLVFYYYYLPNINFFCHCIFITGYLLNWSKILTANVFNNADTSQHTIQHTNIAEIPLT